MAVQVSFTFLLSLRVFVPRYEENGLAGAIGAHMAWNLNAGFDKMFRYSVLWWEGRMVLKGAK